MSQPLKTLIAKLNDTTRRAAERAASLCMAQGHHEVEVEHLLLALLEQPGSDLVAMCRFFEVPLTALQHDLQAQLQTLKTGNQRTPVFGVHLPTWLEHAWLIASLEDPSLRIRSAHLVWALLTDPSLRQLALRASARLAQFRVEDIKHRLDLITHGSQESPTVCADDTGLAVPQPAGDGLSARPRSPALDQFTTNLTQRALDGKLDPVIGRDAEIRQAIDILMRRRQNNPILTGEAGVGKTAVVEGLALKIAQGDVPAPLQGVVLHVLDMGLLQAGASVKGEFENRLKQVIDEVKQSPQPIVLFIDEAHTLIGAGGQAGQNDAANLLKPALARGELRTIAATTWGEYKKYFEKDAALARRFQVVKVEEPSEQLACAMLRGMAPLMEQHFQVRLLDEAITEAVRLSARYISDRQLPDKAVSVLDTACARVALGQSATPALIDDARKLIERIDAEMSALQREQAQVTEHHSHHSERLDQLASQRTQVQAELQALESRWAFEHQLVHDILALRGPMDAASQADESHTQREAHREALAGKLAELRALQGEQALVPLQVDAQSVAAIVSGWTGIPLGKMVRDEIEAVQQLLPALRARVIGQDHALAAIVQRVKTSRAGLEDPHKPKGVFLLVGPSGVGKTETALALADLLYGGERQLITINMSEYQEAHSVSGLKGSPPGYVGYGEGGVLTEAVRRKPHSVVLLDEVEKAHPDVLEMFFQVFDKGRMDDAEGREIDFRNTVILLTSNIGTQGVMQACLNKSKAELPDADALVDALRPALYKAFKPAFVGRTKVVPYHPLGDEVLTQVIRLKLDRIAQRVAEQHRAVLACSDALVQAVLQRCTEVDTGARAVDHILNGTLLPELADHVLGRMCEGQGLSHIQVTADKQGRFKYKVS